MLVSSAGFAIVGAGAQSDVEFEADMISTTPDGSSGGRVLGHIGALFCVVLAVLGSCGANTRSVAAEFDRDLVSAFVSRAFDGDRVPGGAVAIVRDGQTIFLEAFGKDASGRPVTPETGFRLGSMSKAFTAMAVLRLVEAGTLSLDQTVQSVLPSFQLADPEVAGAITVRHLLAHTSGIPERAPRAERDASLAEHVSALDGVTPTGRPGERHVYASPNYLVAARLLEVMTGKPFEKILQEEVLGPLRMEQSYVSKSQDERAQLSGGHQYWFGFPFPSQLPEDRGRLATASLISSARDMAKFLAFQLGDGSFEGSRLLSSDSMILMHRGSAEGDGFRYAMGWRDTSLLGMRAVEHGGILPDYRGKMILLPEVDAAVVVLTNASSGAPLPAQPTSHRLADDIAGYLAGGELKHPTLTFGTVSIAVAIGLGLILFAAAAELGRVLLGRGRRDGQLLRNVIDVSIVAGIAVALPTVLGLDWPSIFATMPDFAFWMSAVAFISVATVIARLLSGSTEAQ